MDLKIKDVAGILNVSETTIRRWLTSGKIPAYRLNGQYRFSKIEIENWMMECRIQEQRNRGEKQIFPGPEVQTGPQHFSLFRSIHRGGVFSNVKGDTKEEVIQNAMQPIAEKLGSDAEVLTELLLDREAMMPTALGGGLAVPHSRECLQTVPFDLVAVVFPEKPLDYGALDGRPVDTLFFLFATGDKMHLHLLAKIAHLSSDEAALEVLRAHPDKTGLLEFIREWEKSSVPQEK